MPSLQRLTCHIDLEDSNQSLKEYKTRYRDGYVETFVAIPSEPAGFNIHLTSSGYIAEGLSMFVYIDGVYQCNRYRGSLVIPDGISPSRHTNVDFRVRQKEEKRGGGKFIGRSWTFQQLNTVTDESSCSLDPNVLGNIGTIEVVVLRVLNDSAKSELPPRQYPSKGKATAPAAKPPAKVTKAASDAKASDDLGGFGLGLFDGPSDILPEDFCFGLDGYYDFEDYRYGPYDPYERAPPALPPWGASYNYGPYHRDPAPIGGPPPGGYPGDRGYWSYPSGRGPHPVPRTQLRPPRGETFRHYRDDYRDAWERDHKNPPPTRSGSKYEHRQDFASFIDSRSPPGPPPAFRRHGNGNISRGTPHRKKHSDSVDDRPSSPEDSGSNSDSDKTVRRKSTSYHPLQRGRDSNRGSRVSRLSGGLNGSNSRRQDEPSGGWEKSPRSRVASAAIQNNRTRSKGAFRSHSGKVSSAKSRSGRGISFTWHIKTDGDENTASSAMPGAWDNADRDDETDKKSDNSWNDKDGNDGWNDGKKSDEDGDDRWGGDDDNKLNDWGVDNKPSDEGDNNGWNSGNNGNSWEDDGNRNDRRGGKRSRSLSRARSPNGRKARSNLSRRSGRGRSVSWAKQDDANRRDDQGWGDDEEHDDDWNNNNNYRRGESSDSKESPENQDDSGNNDDQNDNWNDWGGDNNRTGNDGAWSNNGKDRSGSKGNGWDSKEKDSAWASKKDDNGWDSKMDNKGWDSKKNDNSWGSKKSNDRGGEKSNLSRNSNKSNSNPVQKPFTFKKSNGFSNFLKSKNNKSKGNFWNSCNDDTKDDDRDKKSQKAHSNKSDKSKKSPQSKNGGSVGNSWNNNANNDSWGNNDNQNNSGGGWGNDGKQTSGDGWGNNDNSGGGGWGDNNNNNDNSQNNQTSWDAPKSDDGNKSKKSEKPASNKSKKPESHSSSHKAASAVSFVSDSSLRSFVKPYWTAIHHRQNGVNYTAEEEPNQSERGRSGSLYIAPAEPLYSIPEEEANKRHVKHQVRAGKGAEYMHRTGHPEYIDTMEKPYAVFCFKYRSKDMLEKMLDITIDEDTSDVNKLKNLSKDELMEEVLRLRSSSKKTSSNSGSVNGGSGAKSYASAKVNKDSGSSKAPSNAGSRNGGWGNGGKDGKESKDGGWDSGGKNDKKDESGGWGGDTGGAAKLGEWW